MEENQKSIDVANPTKEYSAHESESKKCETFEDLLEISGSMGYFQIRLFVILTLMDLATGSCMYYFVFANAVPDFVCADGYSNATTNELRCKSLDGSECMAYNFTGKVSFISEFSLVCTVGNTYIPKLATSIQMAGVVVSAFISGQLADTFGRKKTLLFMATFMLAFHISTGFANSWQLFIALRFFVGFCTGGTLALDFSIPMEFIGTKWRTLCGSLSIFEFALFVLALFDYLGLNWRYLAFASGALCAPLLLCILIWVPESVRWLMQKGKYKEAEDIMKKLAATNGKPVGDLSILRKIAEKDKEEHEKAQFYSYWHLFRNRKIALWTITLIIAWFSCSCNLYGFSDMFDTLGGSMVVNVSIATAVAMPMGWSVIFLGNKLGRKVCFLMFSCAGIACTVAIVIIGLVDNEHKESTAVAVFAILGRAGIATAWIVGFIFTAELYPTLLRNIGLGAANTAARIGGIAAPQVTYLGGVTHWTAPYAGFAIMMIASVILIAIFIPETAGKPLPETMGEEENLEKPANKKAAIQPEMNINN